MKAKDIDALYTRWGLVDGNKEDDEFAKKLRREIDRAVREERREERKRFARHVLAMERDDELGALYDECDEILRRRT